MDVSDLMRELRELRQRVDDFPVQASPTQDSLPEVVILKDPARKLTNLKPTSFPTYDGDRATYPAWRRAVLSALRIDWNTFEYTDSRVFLMIYKALEGRAQKQAACFFESGGVANREKPEDFITFLDRGNWDQTRVSRAKSELNQMKMGPKQKWNQFYSLWANKLTEAAGDIWPDDVKISLLQTTLNTNLRLALANNHLIPENDFPEYVRIVSKIAQQHEEIFKMTSGYQGLGQATHNSNRNSVGSSGYSQKFDNANVKWGRSGTERGPVGRVDNTGDTFMGGINSAEVLRGPNGNPLRAKWKSPEQISNLRKEGRCYRCERRGCSTKVCKILPAINPNNRREGVRVANIEPLNLDLFDEDEAETMTQNHEVPEN